MFAVFGGDEVEYVDSQREARERANELTEQGYNAYVQNLSPELPGV